MIHDFGGGALFDDPAVDHDRDPVSDTTNGIKVMRNEQNRQICVFPQRKQGFEHMPLHIRVQRGHRFIGHQQFRLRRKGARDGHTLALPAGQGARFAVQILGFQPDNIQ